MMRRQQGQQDQQSKMIYELSSIVMNMLRSPPTPIDFSDGGSSVEVVRRGRRSRGEVMQEITPAGFASLLLGISLALMLCGSVTFFIGFMLMPWVVGLVLVFYVVGVVSSLSMLGRAIFCHISSPPSSPKNDCSSWKLLW
ncbi:hypothetical protein Leryth_008106 [Lithospermum erythrorhizon]|nr:hypothetical protein Leryth_008106 [Lithospermum erythrorhizon]